MDHSHKDVLHKLTPSVVEIISDKEEKPRTLGIGFVVGDDGLIVTRRHIVTIPKTN